MDNDMLIINIYGKRFQVDKNVLQQHKGNKLSSLDEDSQYYNKSKKEFYFRRNVEIFSSILDYYNSGKMHYPQFMCAGVLRAELDFWGLDDTVLAPCCWHRFQSELEADVVLQTVREVWNSEVPTKKELENTTCRNQLYIFMKYPTYTSLSRLWSVSMMVLICISVIGYMIETVPAVRTFLHQQFEEKFQNLTEQRLLYFQMHTRAHISLMVTEVIATTILSLDFILRFISYQSKIQFVKNIYNIVDFLGIFPVFIMAIMLILRSVILSDLITIELFSKVFFSFNTFRILRVLRLIRFAQHYKTLKLIYLALKSSLKELTLLIFLLTILAVFFANIVFLAEIAEDNIWSIPEGLWWAYITMTTVGYGDYYPKGIAGYIVGVICAMMGILVIALPIPVVVNNFNNYYASAQKVERERKYTKLNGPLAKS